VSRDVRVSVQNNIDVVRLAVRRNVLETEFQSAAHEIDNQWPIQIAVAISSYDCQSRPDRVQFVQNALSANIAEVPDFIGAFSHFGHRARQAIVGVREDENTLHIFSSMFGSRHISFKFRYYLHGKTKARPVSPIVDGTRLDRDAGLVPQTRDNSRAWL
jgi:hypothetical protein